VAFINDSLDPSRHNTEWYIHPDFPDKLLVISTADIVPDAQLFIPYGADYWCQDKFPIAVLSAAIRCYNIDIHSSPQWSQLQAYSQLCTLFPKTSSQPTFDLSTILSDYSPSQAELRLFDLLSGSRCPQAVHCKPSLESSRSRKHHRQAYHRLIAHCRNNQRIHALYLQSSDLDHSHLQHLADILPTTNIYAINLGEASFSSDSLQFIHDFLPQTSITQIYLHHHPNTKLLQSIQRRADQNRAKVQAHYASNGIIPAEWSLISKKSSTPVGYTDDYGSTQSTSSTDHLDPHPPPSQDHDIAPSHPTTLQPSLAFYDPAWNRYKRSQHTTTMTTYSTSSTASISQSVLQFRHIHNQIFPQSPLWSQEGDARAAPSSPGHKRKRSEPLEDASSSLSPALLSTAVSVVPVIPAETTAPDPRVDSPTVYSRSVRARGLTTMFDSAMFRTIFSSRILSEPGISYDSHSGSTDRSFSFSFSFNFAACTNSATTLDYDKHIADS
jgi:hypothetical protein